MNVLLVAVLAGTLGLGSAPAGFKEAPRLEPAASSVAGKPVKVWCATTRAAFDAANGTDNSDAAGFTAVGGTNLYLHPTPCAYLHAWLNGKNPASTYAVAAGLLTIAHEASHARGVSSEAQTDCAALHAIPAMVRKFFPLKGRISMHDLMAIAWDVHGRQPAQYQGVC